MEEWKDIERYEGKYKVSNLGNIKNILTNYLFKKRIGNRGYHTVILYLNGKASTVSVHRLIAIAFIPNPENKPQINHINGIRSDNSIENLEWCTASENQKHKFKVLGYKIPEYQIESLRKSCREIGKRSKRNKKVNQYTKDGEFVREWDSLTSIGNELGINIGNISSYCNGERRFKNVGGFIWEFK